MGNKYIIELEEVPFAQDIEQGPARGVVMLWRVKGFNSLVFDANGLDKLKSAEDALDSAYAHGRTSAEAEYYAAIEEEKAKAFDWGLDTAWQVAKAIGKMSDDEVENMFETGGATNTLYGVIDNHSAQEALRILKQKEKEEEMIGLRQNINMIITDCGYSLEEIYETVKEMRDES